MWHKFQYALRYLFFQLILSCVNVIFASFISALELSTLHVVWIKKPSEPAVGAISRNTCARVFFQHACFARWLPRQRNSLSLWEMLPSSVQTIAFPQAIDRRGAGKLWTQLTSLPCASWRQVSQPPSRVLQNSFLRVSVHVGSWTRIVFQKCIVMCPCVRQSWGGEDLFLPSS